MSPFTYHFCPAAAGSGQNLKIPNGSEQEFTYVALYVTIRNASVQHPSPLRTAAAHGPKK